MWHAAAAATATATVTATATAASPTAAATAATRGTEFFVVTLLQNCESKQQTRARKHRNNSYVNVRSWWKEVSELASPVRRSVLPGTELHSTQHLLLLYWWSMVDGCSAPG